MPNIFDNIDQRLLPALRSSLTERCLRADFCVGYFNLRGWDALADLVDKFKGTDESCCCVLAGMYRSPDETMRDTYRAIRREECLDGPTTARLRREAAKNFREQIEFGVPSAAAQAALQKLATQLRAHQVRVKLFLRHPLHAKLYLVHRDDNITKLVDYLGSSNLSFSGLEKQGELNVDVVDSDATAKLNRSC